jgi:hypothetical protein
VEKVSRPWLLATAINILSYEREKKKKSDRNATEIEKGEEQGSTYL